MEIFKNSHQTKWLNMPSIHDNLSHLPKSIVLKPRREIVIEELQTELGPTLWAGRVPCLFCHILNKLNVKYVISNIRI